MNNLSWIFTVNNAIGYEAFVRLALAVILGGIIGYERQARRKSAGLRTNVLVCLGSCLIMILSHGIYAGVEGMTNADPARLAAQVVSGIGFLGAGAIMKEGPTVTGITTAACLWVVAGVGLAVGAGFYSEAFFATFLIFVTVGAMGRIDHWLSTDKYMTVGINVYEGVGYMRRFFALFELMNLEVKGVRMKTNEKIQGKNDKDAAAVYVEIDLASYDTIDRPAVVDALMKMKSVKSVEVL